MPHLPRRNLLMSGAAVMLLALQKAGVTDPLIAIAGTVAGLIDGPLIDGPLIDGPLPASC